VSNGLGNGVDASVILGSVWVHGLRVNALGINHILESPVHPATIAALVSFSLRAVDQVLFTQRDELAGLAESLSFKRTSGRESPAGAAVSLILDRGDVSLGSPIDGRGDFDVEGAHKHLGVGWGVLGNSQTVSGLDEFLVGHVSESVHAEGVGVLTEAGTDVVVLDLLQILFPDGATDQILGRFVVLSYTNEVYRWKKKSRLVRKNDREFLPNLVLYASQSSSSSTLLTR